MAERKLGGSMLISVNKQNLKKFTPPESVKDCKLLYFSNNPCK